ncbi:unnamed protein product [Calicophoron daubneyi]|uniref:Proton-coupled folate transporter n=1 Tax=Calicophoron daubneyi TaxID=300641 RepID=A0AAV2TWE7_CALDB
MYTTVCSSVVNLSTEAYLCSPSKQTGLYISGINRSEELDYHSNNGSKKDVEIEIQRLSSVYLLAYRFLFNLPATVSCLIFGSWSNRIGRKWSMMVPCAGAAIACAWFACGLAPNFKPVPEAIIFILVGALFYGACGKSNAMSMGANSYITDLSSPKERTKLLARLMGVSFFGLCIGAGLLALFYRYRGIAEVLMFSASSNAMVMLILLIFVRESREACEEPCVTARDHKMTNRATTEESSKQVTSLQNSKEKRGSCNCFVIFFRALKDSYHFLFRKREDYPRSVLFLLFTAVLFNQMTKSGEQDAILLFVTNKPFRWSAELYGYYLTTYYGCMAVILTLILPIIEAHLRPRDTTLILIGMSFKIARLLTMGLTRSTTLMFVSAVAGSAAGFISSGTRSLISKLVHNNDVGASFALVSCMETLANLFGGSLFTAIYNVSIPVFPGAVFVCDAVMHAGMMCGFIWLRYTITDTDDSGITMELREKL